MVDCLPTWNQKGGISVHEQARRSKPAPTPGLGILRGGLSFLHCPKCRRPESLGTHWQHWFSLRLHGFSYSIKPEEIEIKVSASQPLHYSCLLMPKLRMASLHLSYHLFGVVLVVEVQVKVVNLKPDWHQHSIKGRRKPTICLINIATECFDLVYR